MCAHHNRHRQVHPLGSANPDALLRNYAEFIRNLPKYEAVDYVAGVKIVDIDKASYNQTGQG